jgi:hypothetical protein
MANREQRGNRETKKKPKAKQPKTPGSQASPFSRAPGAELKKATDKKSR